MNGIEEITDEQLEQTMETIGKTINSKLVETKKEIDDILNKYGLSVEICFDIRQKSN